MVNFCSQKIMSYLVKVKSLSKEDKEEIAYYKYGVEITLSSIWNVIIILSIGILCGRIIESVIFLVCFIPLRQFTGGYHADSYLKCHLTFCMVFLIVLNLYIITWETTAVWAEIILCSLCLIVIYRHCPVENVHKKISDEQKIKLRYISLLFSLLLFSTGVLLSFANKYGIMVLYTLYSITALIIVAKLKERRIT